jgi:hypothetical protein
MRQFQQHKIHLIFKEANSCADLLAKADCAQSVDFVFYVSPTAHVLDVLKFDVLDFVFSFSFGFYLKKEKKKFLVLNEYWDNGP